MVVQKAGTEGAYPCSEIRDQGKTGRTGSQKCADGFESGQREAEKRRGQNHWRNERNMSAS